MTINFEDSSLVDTRQFAESGPCYCADGQHGYSVFISPCNVHTEVILTERELRLMLAEIEQLK